MWIFSLYGLSILQYSYFADLNTEILEEWEVLSDILQIYVSCFNLKQIRDLNFWEIVFWISNLKLSF